MKDIIVDLTPILPGGDNGGAKIMTIELIRNLAKLTPNYNFILLTLPRNHNELKFLDSHNVKRTLLVQPSNIKLIYYLQRIRNYILIIARKVLPAFIRLPLKSVLNRLKSTKAYEFPEKDNASLVFYPLTRGLYHHKSKIPTISVIYDLQYKYHPKFFSYVNRNVRDHNFKEACHDSDYLVCISDFVRKTVLENSDFDLNKVKTIHISLANRLPTISAQQCLTTLGRFALQKDKFLFYPANFWKHKNHETLFLAYKKYREQNPKALLKLACTGALEGRMNYLSNIIAKMNLQDWIILPGYLTNKEFAALAQSCKALIFPSLYEGFGMPIVEFMNLGKPVLCSNLTSLPEIADNAALFFNPENPEEICNAIERLDADEKLIAKLIKKGYKQAKKFSDPMDMARKYLNIFQLAMKSKEIKHG